MPEEPSSKPLFDLSLTDEQQLMRDSARKFAEAEMRPVARKYDEAGETPRGFYEKIGFRWIRNWLPYRLSGKVLDALAIGKK